MAVERVTPQLVELTYDAALKSFWRKKALGQFLRTCHISERYLTTWDTAESKRDFLDRVFTALQQSDKGRQAILYMAESLAGWNSFPDLEHWEDSAEKIRDATAAVARLRRYLREQREEVQRRQDREEAQERIRARHAEVSRQQTDLQKLNERLDELSKRIGTQQAGYDFQVWFYDLLDFCEVDNRRPYTHGGRQIDGSLTISGTTYLVELKFTAGQAGAPDVDTFLQKIAKTADNTMGIMVSMSGYSSVAIQEASGPRTPVLLLDHSHLYLALCGTMPFAETIERVRRHASQTGEAYLSPSRFGE